MQATIMGLSDDMLTEVIGLYPVEINLANQLFVDYTDKRVTIRVFQQQLVKGFEQFDWTISGQNF